MAGHASRLDANSDSEQYDDAITQNKFNHQFNIIYNTVVNLDAKVISIIVAIVVVLITLIFYVVRGAAAKRRDVMFVGRCESGKTLIYSRLIYNMFLSTQTSIKENKAAYNVSNTKKTVRLVDLPGHERVRFMFFDKYRATTRGIIIVIDSVTFQKDWKDVAELMYTVLVDDVVTKNCPAILVACNKHDQPLAKGAKVIQSTLEKELNTLRVTRMAALATTEETDPSVTLLGRTDHDFAFSDLKFLRIEFVECSARCGKDEDPCDLEAVKDWIGRIA